MDESDLDEMEFTKEVSVGLTDDGQIVVVSELDDTDAQELLLQAALVMNGLIGVPGRVH